MKTAFNKVLHAAVAAAALTFAGASHADDYGNLQNVIDLEHKVSAVGNSFFGKNVTNGEVTISAAAITMANYDNFAQQYLAYCIEPKVDFVGGTYTAVAYQPSVAVRQLYESAYASTVGKAPEQFAFQLALWELTNDDGTLTSGKQYYALGTGTLVPEFQLAENMLINARSTSLGGQHYSYVSFVSQEGGQALLGVSAVPEADTWAMMAVGLGLLGVLGRRQPKNEKFV